MSDNEKKKATKSISADKSARLPRPVSVVYNVKDANGNVIPDATVDMLTVTRNARKVVDTLQANRNAQIAYIEQID